MSIEEAAKLVCAYLAYMSATVRELDSGFFRSPPGMENLEKAVALLKDSEPPPGDRWPLWAAGHAASQRMRWEK